MRLNLLIIFFYDFGGDGLVVYIHGAVLRLKNVDVSRADGIIFYRQLVNLTTC